MHPAESAPASTTGPYADDLALALRLADAADAVSMTRFDAGDLDVEAKADATFVTEADLDTERALRSVLDAERPADGVLGEEFGSAGSAERRWVIDPIDGTHNYLRGIPMWATLIALTVDGAPKVGVVSQPALARRWWAAEGQGAWTRTPDGAVRRIRVSEVSDLARASISFQSIEQWEDAGHLAALLDLRRRVWRDRGYGDALPYMWLAEGRLEMVAEFDVKEYDIAALAAIITEAGGRFTAFDGSSSLTAGSSLATNGALYDEIFAALHAADARTSEVAE